MRKLLFIAFMLAATLSKGQLQMMFTADSLFGITSPLGVDSLFYWFAADLGVLDSLGGTIANNEGVGTWADQSGNGYNITQTTDTDRPVYKATGGAGSKPALQFDGSDDYMTSTAHFWGSDDITIFVVGKWASATRNVSEAVIGKGTGSGDKRNWQFYGGNTAESYFIRLNAFKDGAATNVTNYTTDTEDKSATNKLYAATSNGAGTYTLYVDGSVVATTRSVGGTGDDTIFNDNTAGSRIGINLGGTLFSQMTISEIIVYSRAITTAQRVAIETYLNKKYDLY